MHEFFSFSFPFANIFFVLRPPPLPHKFSNGPSLTMNKCCPVTSPTFANMLIPCFRQTTRTSYDGNRRQPEARIGNVPTGNSMDTNLVMRKNIVIRDF